MNKRNQSAVDREIEAQGEVSAAGVREELERILGSAPFLNSRRPSQFLRFVVEITLAGEGDRIKEYLIAVEVFGRPEHYDPKGDAIVRIEAGRLRKKLAEYYSGPGRNDDVIIELPKGRYVPDFQPRSSAKQPEIIYTEPGKSSRILRKGAAALALIAAVALAAAYYVRLRSSTSVPKSIAVLPFLDLSGAPGREYLSVGVTEELTTGLAETTGLRVVAATSALQFRGKADDVRKIGRALNAEAVLEGSIGQSGNGLRIHAQLIDARNGYHLWSKAYDVQSADLQTPEKDIVQETARVLHVRVGPDLHPLKRDTESSEAHDLYLQGRYLWNTRQLPDMLESVRLFERAIQDDPNYALAHAGLADSFTVMAINMQMSPAEAVPRAKAELQRALELDPSLARAHATMGLLKSQCEWDRQAAQQEFGKAIELEPNYAPAHHWAGLNYMEIGQFATAEAEFRAAQVLDPLSPMITEGLVENFYHQRRYDEAISTVLNMPNGKVGWVVLAEAYILEGRYQETFTLPEVAHPADVNGWLLRADALVRSGDRPGGLKILGDLGHNGRSSGVSPDYIPPGRLAWGYAMAGEKERAFTWLEKAYEQHDPTLADLKIDPGFDDLRSDPRYIDLVKKVGLGN
jgi:TolB-like protein